MLFRPAGIACVATVLPAAIAGSYPTSSLPVVDLGYERHRAALFDGHGFYNFSNIRYAQPPVGNLRFRAPVPPQGRSERIDDGSVGRICPQAQPIWLDVAPNATIAALSNQTFDVDAALAEASQVPVVQDPRTTEDCLFLDVLTPKPLFEKAQATNFSAENDGVPVLVWIYPGGWVVGDKTSENFDMIPLLNTSYGINPDGVVAVSINYRLGVFGWLAGPSVQADGTAQPALHDQRLALQWVQDNIHLFGGNKNKVTIMGYSAGAASVIHQITAYGGKQGPPLFQQAIVDSAAVPMNPSKERQEEVFSDYLKLLNVTSIQEARKLPSSAVIKANLQQNLGLPYATFVYGPVVDGDFVPDLPGKLLLEGSFYKDINVMTGRTQNEGILFTDPRLNSTAEYDHELELDIRGITPTALDYINNVLYPANFDGSTGYQSQYGRGILTYGEAALTCNGNYLGHAFQNKTHAFQTGLFPSFHSSDLGYIFYNGDPSSVLYPDTAVALGQYIMSFVLTGKPSAPGFPIFPEYGVDNLLLTLNGTAAGTIRDPSVNPRCEWWQQGLFEH